MIYFEPRGDLFYYLEVFDKQALREFKLTAILGGDSDIIPKYAGGNQRSLIIYEDIYMSLFWKSKKTAELRIKLLYEDSKIKDNYTLVVKFINRDEFIKAIPDTSRGSHYAWKKNLKTKQNEIGYLRKLNKIKLELE